MNCDVVGVDIDAVVDDDDVAADSAVVAVQTSASGLYCFGMSLCCHYLATAHPSSDN